MNDNIGSNAGEGENENLLFQFRLLHIALYYYLKTDHVSVKISIVNPKANTSKIKKIRY